MSEIEPFEPEPRCGFHAHNPLSGKLAQCIDPAEVTVIVRAMPSNGIFQGGGVETLVCRSHGRQLVDGYGAVLVPNSDEGDRR